MSRQNPFRFSEACAQYFSGAIVVLNRLRKLVFRVRSQSPTACFGDSLRRVNHVARLMTIMQRKRARKAR